MGTRALTYFYDENAHLLACVYRQYDGYPEAHGTELAKFLSNLTLRNGFSLDDKMGTHANGMGCLTAQYIAMVKMEIGNHYVIAPKLNQDAGQEYEYHVHADSVAVYSTHQKQHIYNGPWNDETFFNWCQNPEAEEEEEEEDTWSDTRSAL